MTDKPAYMRLSFDPVADPRAVVVCGPARFTILTSRLIRAEYEPDGQFEDRPSQVFWYRRQPVPDFRAEEIGDLLVLTTEHLRLEYVKSGGLFTSQSLSITLLPDGPAWQYGDFDESNLFGTTRTLDRVNGGTPLEPGILSRSGWAVIDDSRTLVFDDSSWLVERTTDINSRDLYFFGYSQNYRDAMRDYCVVAGGVPLLPRWVLGNWWSRYWRYSDKELRDLMTEFRQHEIPLSVCIIDMDWHLVEVGEGISGWTGYTWNRDLFPNPPGFIHWLHDQGLRTALNLHPALGIRPHEEMYTKMAERLGLDPAANETIPFDIADHEFTDAYFEVLHHPQEEDGIDFWWMDWQQGTQTAVAGLDPLWWLNHLHYFDLGRNGKRPFVFSRWGGLGNHRYPIGFSGDTIVSWESLAFQPYFTATAANVAYGWWSHDIGGHMKGKEDRELYTRWVQFGVFSPILRLHSTNNPQHERRPWGYDAEVLQTTRDAMQLRHAFIPYMYTMSWLGESSGQMLVRPMYHDYPDQPQAYECPQQYLFGTDLVVAPYTAPADSKTGLSRQSIWLPKGEWFHFFSGERYSGDAHHTRRGRLHDIPVFARAGAIIPLGPRVGWGGVGNPAELYLHVFAGEDGRFVLFEDDGVSMAYREGKFALTRFEQRWSGGSGFVLVGPSSGDLSILAEARTYYLIIYGITTPHEVAIEVDGRSLTFDIEEEGRRICVEPLTIPTPASVEVSIGKQTGPH